MKIANELFQIAGWIFAMISNVIWLVICLRISNSWYKQLNDILTEFDNMFKEMNTKYADFCRKQNEDWLQITTKTIGGDDDGDDNESRE